MPAMLLGTVPIGQNGFQPLPITRPKPDIDVAAHVDACCRNALHVDGHADPARVAYLMSSSLE